MKTYVIHSINDLKQFESDGKYIVDGNLEAYCSLDIENRNVLSVDGDLSVNSDSRYIKGYIQLGGSIETRGYIMVDGSIKVNGFIKTSRSIKVSGCIQSGQYIDVGKYIEVDGFIEASGYIKANESIKTGSFIKAGNYIEAGDFIDAGGFIMAGRYIKAGESIYADESVNAGEFIKANEYIKAAMYIKSDMYIEAGEDILAGNKYGITVGLSIKCTGKLYCGLKILAGISPCHEITDENKTITCHKLEGGIVAHGILVETGIQEDDSKIQEALELLKSKGYKIIKE